MLFGKKSPAQQNQQNGDARRKTTSSFPPWRKCCFGICSVGTGARLVVCLQILVSVGFLLATLFGYAGQHEINLLTDIFLITVITHASLALLCAALVFLALHFRRPWLLVFELVFLILAILQHLAASVIFEIYVLRDGLKWLTGRTQCYPTSREGFVCKPVPQSDWPIFDWWNLFLAGVYLLAAVLTVWFFRVILKSYFYLRKKCADERRRREKAAETMGLLGSGGGGLVAACGAGNTSAAGSSAMHSRNTLTTSLTTTTYDHSVRDPDLLLRY